MDLIKQDVLGGKSEKHGTQGLCYWEILVLSTVRHGCNFDYDALRDLDNNHKEVLEMMGLGDMDIKQYSRSTIQENIAKVFFETIEKISNLVIGEGHSISPKAIERVRGDSFVVQTNVHHPTDANLIRVILDEKIPHNEKVFSYFAPHTELINRGKSPYPIEFDHRVLVIQDLAGFVLKHLIMEHTTDDKVLIPVMKDLQEQYGGKIISAGFDKGFWGPQNLIELEKIVRLACLP